MYRPTSRQVGIATGLAVIVLLAFVGLRGDLENAQQTAYDQCTNPIPYSEAATNLSVDASTFSTNDADIYAQGVSYGQIKACGAMVDNLSSTWFMRLLGL